MSGNCRTRANFDCKTWPKTKPCGSIPINDACSCSSQIHSASVLRDNEVTPLFNDESDKLFFASTHRCEQRVEGGIVWVIVFPSPKRGAFFASNGYILMFGRFRVLCAAFLFYHFQSPITLAKGDKSNV